jgi:uncharacterized protein (DUF58 family)
VLNALQQRFSTWALRRQRYDSGTVTLNQRSIYILPTRQGFAFCLVLVVMLLGDINYNLSLGYVLTFLLATMGGMSMLHTFRNMAQLQIRAGHVEPVFAGEPAHFVFHVHNASMLNRYQINLHDAQGRQTVFDVAARGHTEAALSIPALRRGWLEPGRLTLYTRFPLGLFHAWSYLRFDVRSLVYPRPAARIPLPAASAHDGSGKQPASGDEDFAGLRGYVAGDTLQRIAWKALAREQGLQVKQFHALQGRELWLDWSQLPAIADERKLELLTRWVLDAELQGLRFGLRLPGVEMPPAQGQSHRGECLRALALYGVEN